MPQRYRPELLRRLHGEVLALWDDAVRLEAELAAEIEAVPPASRGSAVNLAHYLALRRRDIRAVQMELSHLGLSSLGRLEAHVAAGLESVILALGRIADEPLPTLATRTSPSFFREGDELLARHTDELLGPQREPDVVVRRMVTLPSEAADDPAFARAAVDNGMDVARINAAHDDAEAWRRMAQHVRAAASAAGRQVRVLIDLAGPKLRTGALEPGPEVVRARPRRDARGVVVERARILLAAGDGGAAEARPTGVGSEVPVDAPFAAALRVGDVVRLRDAPGRGRRLDVVGRTGEGVLVEARATVWFESGLRLEAFRDGDSVAVGRVGRLPARPSALLLRTEDLVVVTADPAPGRPAVRDASGALVEPARIPCSIPAVLGSVRAGEPISFDDGSISGVVERASAEELLVRVTSTAPGGRRLRADKGINFPRSFLDLPSLTEDDLGVLDAAVGFVDIVGLSFVRSADDVLRLHAALDERGAPSTATVLKIETRLGFEHLPEILFAALRRPPVGVMVARGDLAAEVGMERMAEVQEQILWLCEAAHVPVIWATQVLESLVKTGMPTRGEVTDAAMSGRAECVMLNKGPYVIEALAFLGGVLARMRDHHIKKTAMLRRLKVSEGRWVRPRNEGG